MWRELSAYYLGHTFRKSRAQFGPDGPLDRVLNHSIRTTEFWFWPPLPQLRISPYFAFHYLFAKLARTDKRFHEAWRSDPGMLRPTGLTAHTASCRMATARHRPRRSSRT